MLKIYKIFLIPLLVVLIISNLSCDAPRLNPLDPLNPERKIYNIEGYVFSFALPRTPISNALIIWENENLATLSNNNGYFQLNIQKTNSGWLKVFHSDFKRDSFFITWNSNKVYKEFYLNQIPKLDSIEFYTILLNQYPNLQTTTLQIRVKVADRDNDIDSVYIENSSNNMRYHLIYNLQSKFFERNFNEFDLDIEDFSELIGINFNIIVKDIKGDFFKVGEEKINRVIKNEIILETPLNNDTVSTRPYLRWRRFIPGFKFYYIVEIYNNEFPPRIVWTKNNISMDSTAVQVDTDLSSGNYFWVIWSVDQFLNRARSKPGSFVVK